jgi:H+/Cl- antiporter ClcA
MAPMIFGATFIAQLTGASVGREGAALQISGSVTSLLTRPFRLRPSDTRLMLIAAMAGAFGGAFGVPMAGAIFGLEVQQTGRLRYEGLAPALAASITADLIVESLGRHTPMVNIPINIDWSIALRLVLVGIAAGLAARLFIEVLHGVKKTISDLISWVPGRPVIGALATLALMLIFGRDYLGLSLPLVEQALGGSVASWWDPVLKILFTAIALGCAIPGGEVTPLFVVGATLGSAMSGPLHLSPTLTAAACLAAVFGAAANAPIACAVLAIELFGADMAIPAGIVCIVAYAISPKHGIYEGQRHGSMKDLRATAVQPHRS